MVKKERPELEEQKGMLVRNIASGKKKIQQLEDDILRLETSCFFCGDKTTKTLLVSSRA